MKEPIRNKDAYQKTLYDFSGSVDITCPKCGKKAVVKASDPVKNHPFIDEVRASCLHCGFNDKKTRFNRRKDPKQVKGNILIYGAPVDPYFHFDLWYRVDCNEHEFWAYNSDHLDLLEKHISATLRERTGYPYQVRSIGARIPRWMSSAKNRNEMIALIRKLREKTL